MKHANPPRLTQDPQFGEALRHAAREGLSEPRLARNAEHIERAIGELGAAPAASGAGATGGAATALKVGVPALVLAVAGAWVVWGPLAPGGEAPSSQPAPAAEPAAEVALVPLSSEWRSTEEVGERVDDPVAAESRDPQPAPPAPVPSSQRRAEEPGSSLPDQLALYDAAQTAARAGDPDKALEALDRLLSEHPDTPLKAEAELSRAEYLARAGRTEAAIDRVAALIADPAHSGRKTELLRLLGDLWLKQDNCQEAVKAYRAFAAADGRVDASVSAGLARCGVTE